ncbi:hypothetical protein [Amycolatopsis sp. 195334CR]|uniref:hypothetical protein n=1 Tax=Amycolatopsis sp. 195334CR TaxID=2814588 RepID=UPI001A90C424|nr:hypothetical protein [Amycolatopsis sp. 195334CR]MBN6041197.1 hypothetical protein [Amycolatopsis sp. 195334CR]
MTATTTSGDNGPVNPETAVSELRTALGLWYVGQVGADALVRAACTLLVAGFDGLSLCMLAAVSVRDADAEVPEYLEAALHEVGLDFHPRDTPAAREAGLRAMAAQTLAQVLTPRRLTSWAHCAFGHTTLDLAERLAELDDLYDMADYDERPTGDLDAEVMAEARRLTS